MTVRKNIIVAAGMDLPVLIIGESGTGKEIVARAIHERSRRKQTGTFVPVNSAAIPWDLLEEELFGIEPGVMPGVTKRKIGLWEVAGGGTIFLDLLQDREKIFHRADLLLMQQEQTVTQFRF